MQLLFLPIAACLTHSHTHTHGGNHVWWVCATCVKLCVCVSNHATSHLQACSSRLTVDPQTGCVCCWLADWGGEDKEGNEDGVKQEVSQRGNEDADLKCSNFLSLPWPILSVLFIKSLCYCHAVHSNQPRNAVSVCLLSSQRHTDSLHCGFHNLYRKKHFGWYNNHTCVGHRKPLQIDSSSKNLKF